MKYQYFNSRILLVVNPNGQIRKLFTPFRVQERGHGFWVYVDVRFVGERREVKIQVSDDVVPGVFAHFIKNFVLVHACRWFLSKKQDIPGFVRPNFVLEVGNKLFGFE
jgi:hypothetical protein